MDGPLRAAADDEWVPFARLVEEPVGYGHDGTRKVLKLRPEMADVVAHSWTHGDGDGEQHCHHWSGWLRRIIDAKDAWLNHCHLPVGHSGPHTDGVRQWGDVRTDTGRGCG